MFFSGPFTSVSGSWDSFHLHPPSPPASYVQLWEESKGAYPPIPRLPQEIANLILGLLTTTLDPSLRPYLGLISREGGWHWKSAPSSFHDNRASQKSSKHHRCLPVRSSPDRNSSGHMRLGVGTCSSEEEPKSHWIQVLMSEKHQD